MVLTSFKGTAWESHGNSVSRKLRKLGFELTKRCRQRGHELGFVVFERLYTERAKIEIQIFSNGSGRVCRWSCSDGVWQDHSAPIEFKTAAQMSRAVQRFVKKK